MLLIRFISLLRFSIFFMYFRIIVETFLNWNIVGIQCYIHFRCITQWLDNSICYIVLTTSVTTICHHTYYRITDYITYAVLSSPWLIHSITTSLYLPLSFIHVTHALIPLSTGNYWLVLNFFFLFVCLLKNFLMAALKYSSVGGGGNLDDSVT